MVRLDLRVGVTVNATMRTSLRVAADVLRFRAEASRPLAAVLAPRGRLPPRVERFEKVSVDAGGRPDPRDPRKSGLRAGVKNETSGGGDGRELERARTLLRFRRNVKSEATGRGPAGGLPVPLGEAHSDVPDPDGRSGPGHFGKEVQIGADAPSLLPEKQGIEPDRNAQRVPGESDQRGELGERRAIVRDSRLDGRPAQPRDRKMQINLIIGGK